MKKLAMGVLPWLFLAHTVVAIAESLDENLEAIEVVVVLPLQSGGIDINKIPANVQTVLAEELQQSQALSLADYMNRYMDCVNINDAQNNPLQPDVQYRGFSASLLMGLPQGPIGLLTLLKHALRCCST